MAGSLLVQETALAIWKALPSLQDKQALKPYIARITHNISVSHIRKAVKRPESELTDHHTDSAPRPDETAGKALMRRRLYDAVLTLPLPERQIIGLYLEGFSQKESSEILGLSPTHIGVKLTRIRRKLKTIMDTSS